MRIRDIFKSLFVVGALLAVFAVFGGIREVSAATYYVSLSGSDSNNGSEARPFRTIQKAAGIVNPGDTVIVKDGTYTTTFDRIVNINRAGTSSNWITFKAEHKWGAILDGRNYATKWPMVFDDGAAYIRVEDFDVQYFGDDGFYANSTAHHIYIYRNKIHHINRRTDCNLDCCNGTCTCGSSGAFTGTRTSYFTFDSNILHDIGRLPQGGCSEIYYNHDHGLYLQGSAHSGDAAHKVINNIFYDLQSGWGIVGNGWNKCINNTFYGRNEGRSGHVLLDTAFVLGYEINNNISHSANSYFLVSFGSGNPLEGDVKNNLVYGATLAEPGTCTNMTCTGNILGQDPKFVNLTNKDFHLQSTSPAINKGLAYSERTKDADRNSIVGAPDIGAYEAGGVSEDTIPPAPPAIIEVR